MGKTKKSAITSFGISCIVYGGLMTAVVGLFSPVFYKAWPTFSVPTVLFILSCGGFVLLHIMGIIALITRRSWPVWICLVIIGIYTVLGFVGLAAYRNLFGAAILPIVLAFIVSYRGINAIKEIQASKLPPMNLPADALVLPQQESQADIPTIQLPADTPSATQTGGQGRQN